LSTAANAERQAVFSLGRRLDARRIRRPQRLSRLGHCGHSKPTAAPPPSSRCRGGSARQALTLAATHARRRGRDLTHLGPRPGPPARTHARGRRNDPDSGRSAALAVPSPTV